MGLGKVVPVPPGGWGVCNSDLEPGIIFKPFSRMGCNIANAQKLQNITSNFNNRTGCRQVAYF